MTKRKPSNRRAETHDGTFDDKVEQAYAHALRVYHHRDNLTGLDKGYKYSEGERTGVIAIRFHINEKIGLEELSPAEVFPRDILGVPTDVIEATYVPHQPGHAYAVAEHPAASAVQEQVMVRRSRLDLLQPGISVAHPNVTAGTLGAVVYDSVTGKPCILSNWHVLVGNAHAMPGDPIVQPGPRDGGRIPRDTVAHLERSVLGPEGDAAVAVLNVARGFDPSQFETGVRITTARGPVAGEVLEKSGRTTGVTRGKVDGVGRYFINYSVGRVGIDGFKLVPIVDDNPDDEEISSGGDSGSVWYSQPGGEGVGLHFAGETDPDPKAENAIACHLPAVLRELNVALLPPAIEVQPRTNGHVDMLIASNGHVQGQDTHPATASAGTVPATRVDTGTEHGLGAFDIEIRIRVRPNAAMPD